VVADTRHFLMGIPFVPAVPKIHYVALTFVF